MNMTSVTRNDGELLSEFAATGKEAPFEELVGRHERLVFGVCYRVLGQTHDAEDAAQAVFLTLAHKARALRGRASVAGWLYNVAWHVAMRAREAAAVQQRHEQEAGKMAPSETESENEQQWAQLKPILDRELNALPEKYRLPLILHHLEGRSKEETAVLLGASSGTVSTWLDRGREKLKERLCRRGIVLSAALVATLLTKEAAAAAAPASFAAATAKAAALVTAGNIAAAGVVSAHVTALTQGAIKMIYLAKLKVAAAVLVATTVAGTGVGVVAYRAVAGEAPNPQVKQEKEAEAEPVKNAADQAEALKLAQKEDLPAIALADRAVIELEGKRATVSGAALKKLIALLTVAVVPPSAGEAVATVAFFRKDALLRSIWVYPDGEWGVQRPKPPHWTLGKNAALVPALKEMLKAQVGAAPLAAEKPTASFGVKDGAVVLKQIDLADAVAQADLVVLGTFTVGKGRHMDVMGPVAVKRVFKGDAPKGNLDVWANYLKLNNSSFSPEQSKPHIFFLKKAGNEYMTQAVFTEATEAQIEATAKVAGQGGAAGK